MCSSLFVSFYELLSKVPEKAHVLLFIRSCHYSEENQSVVHFVVDSMIRHNWKPWLRKAIYLLLQMHKFNYVNFIPKYNYWLKN